MIPKILVIGSTGKLGNKLLQFTFKNNIKIETICGFKNKKKLLSQSKKFKIKNKFVLSETNDKKNFLEYINFQKFNIIYFLDYGSQSILYLKLLLNKNKKSYFGIANKELIIASGNLLTKKFRTSNNKIIPLDSEHFSLMNNNFDNSKIQKIFITASGGPFYFNKKINLHKVDFKDVIKHPKWKMGINNSIDSSNFINKIFEVYELSNIYNIDIKKIDFLISKEAFIHSIILYNDGTYHMNCFQNDMIITLIKPLRFFFKLNKFKPKKNILFKNFNFKIEEFKDKRFKITKYKNYLLNLSHEKQIIFMLLNNKAHDLYINNKLKYNDILDYIVSNLKSYKESIKFKNFDDIYKFIQKNIF